MELQRLKELLSRFTQVRLAVLGDFFLDEYLVIDPALAEVSIETRLSAHQVVAVRNSPGAAGTVCSNLVALGVHTQAIGIVGEDGNGFELAHGLWSRRVSTELVLETPERFTPTYTKPMRRHPDGTEVEMERLDIKNRTATPAHLQERIIENLWAAVESVDGMVIEDQVEEEECGVVTAAVREELAQLSRRYPDKVFLADSRCRIGKFRDVMIKPNEREASVALGRTDLREEEMLAALFRMTRRPVFLTCGPRGISGFDGARRFHCPAVPVSGPIDIVGAGDSAGAGLVSALCAGATLEEAAEMGTLVASVTIRKLGTTGTASPEEVIQAWESRG
ncbi:MAG: bifunctional heptose 7-phosphate kinase/heptose 1-phosphate adenyltransferase [Acidobacteriota bacterium]